MVSAKQLAIALCNAALVTKADFTKIADKLVELLSNSSASTRGAAFTPYFRNTIDALQNSGCWCYFDDDHHLAHGEAVNTVDEHCRDLHHGYTCAQIDEGKSCVPWTVDYVASSGLTTHEPRIYEECKFNNGGVDGCEAYACSIETLFVYRIWKYLNENNNEFPADAMHDNGFDQSVCPLPITKTKGPKGPGGNGGNQEPKSRFECCANYPLRFPFDATDGLRRCCGVNTFDALTQTCCDDGVARIVC